MKSSFTILLVILIAGLGCQSRQQRNEKPNPPLRPGWKIVDPGARFTFHLPGDMKEQKVQGIDSFVGEYRNDKIIVSFDYGIYSSDLLYHSKWPEYEERVLTINGRKARIAFFRNEDAASDKKYQGGIHFLVTDDSSTTLTIIAGFSDPQDKETVNAIFESVVF